MTIRKFRPAEKYEDSSIDYYTLDEGGRVYGYKANSKVAIYTASVNWEIFVKFWIDSGYCVEIPA